MFGKAKAVLTGTAGSIVFNSTTVLDTFEGGFGPDRFIADEGTPEATDQLSGGGGADLLSVELGELDFNSVKTALAATQGIETLKLTAQWYDDFDFSSFEDFTAIEMMVSGTTIDDVG